MLFFLYEEKVRQLIFLKYFLLILSIGSQDPASGDSRDVAAKASPHRPEASPLREEPSSHRRVRQGLGPEAEGGQGSKGAEAQAVCVPQGIQELQEQLKNSTSLDQLQKELNLKLWNGLYANIKHHRSGLRNKISF